MIKSILTQTKIMLNKKGFMFGFSAMMMICLLEVVFSSYGVTALRMEGDGFPGNDPSSVITSFEAFILCVPSGLLSYLELLFPFLCALPFSFSILTDKAANTDTLLCAYCGKRRYIISKITAAFIGSFLIFFVPLMINGCLNYLIFDNSMGANLFNPNWRFNGFGVMRATDYPNAPFGELLAAAPFLYSMLHAFMFSLMSGVFGVLALACSVFCRRNKVLTFGVGFLIINIMQFLENYSMNDDIDKKYTALDPFKYVTYYYCDGRSGVNYLAVFIAMGAVIVVSSALLLFCGRKDYI